MQIEAVQDIGSGHLSSPSRLPPTPPGYGGVRRWRPGSLQNPPPELRALMAADPSVLPSSYWIAGNGWDTTGIRSDLVLLYSGKRIVQAPCNKYDSEGRPYDLDIVVVNLVDVGLTYGHRRMSNVQVDTDVKFHWDGVRVCLRHLTSIHLKVVGIIFEQWAGYDGDDCQKVRGIPQDVVQLCEFVEETPRITLAQHRHANDEMTIKLAYRRNCRIMDNDDYAGWLGENRGFRNGNIRRWLEQSQEFLHMNYRFIWSSDSCSFEVCGFTRHNASRSGGLESIADAEINHLREGSTPLFTAVKAGNAELVSRLLERGADPNIPNQQGVYPIYNAVLECNVNIVRSLTFYSADLTLIPPVKYRGLIGNVHWRLGKPNQTRRRRQLLRLLGVDPDGPDPMAMSTESHIILSTPGLSAATPFTPFTNNIFTPVTFTNNIATPRVGALTRGRRPSTPNHNHLRPEAETPTVIRVHEHGPPQATRQKPRRAPAAAAQRPNVIRVHAHGPPQNAEQRRRVQRPTQPPPLGLHPKWPYRRVFPLCRKVRHKKKKADRVVGPIELEEVDLTNEAEAPRRRRRREVTGKEGVCDAVYLKAMRTAGPDARPLVAMIDPYL